MLVANNGNDGHERAIAEILKGAEEISIAIAFLKRAGANHIAPFLKRCLTAGGSVEIYIGSDFFLTEPEALELLFGIREKHPACNIQLAKRGSATFHPKAYVARRGAKYRSLIGSANLTGGALTLNEELSISLTHKAGDPVVAQLLATFERYREWSRFQELDALVLEQYASSYEIDRRERRKYEKARDAALPAAFDLATIDKWLARYRTDPKAIAELATRKQKLGAALAAQNAIVALGRAPITAAARRQFKDDLGDLIGSAEGNRLWGSGSIFRQGSQALENADGMIPFFAKAKSVSKKPVQDGYVEIRAAAATLGGVGLNFATEALCTFAPTHYAVYNGNTKEALKTLGISATASTEFRAVSPMRYAKLCETIKALSRRIGAANLSEADYFLNWIYWEVKAGRGMV
jgi:HKD family nuclease